MIVCNNNLLEALKFSEIIITKKEFKEWLIAENIASFKSVDNIEAYLSSNLVFLLMSGSIFLKRYILKKADFWEKNYGKTNRIGNLNHAWNLFSQKVHRVEADDKLIKILVKD